MAHPSAESINPMQTMTGGLADYLTPGTFGGRRAGRATAMAHAVGEEPSFNVRHPLTSTFGGSLAGGFLGAGLGARAGALAGQGEGAPATGAAIGGLAGAVLASLLLSHSRRGEMQDINDKFDSTKKLDPRRPGYTAMDVVGGFGGSHRMGQIEALKAMTGGKPNRYGTATDVGQTLLGSSLVGLGTGMVQGANASDEETIDPKIRRLKVASVLHRLLAR